MNLQTKISLAGGLGINLATADTVSLKYFLHHVNILETYFLLMLLSLYQVHNL